MNKRNIMLIVAGIVAASSAHAKVNVFACEPE